MISTVLCVYIILPIVALWRDGDSVQEIFSNMFEITHFTLKKMCLFFFLGVK